MEVPLEQKMNMLWSFVKSHLNNKCIVFLSSCKQVKFVYEAFCRLRPGIPLQCLHGKIKQAKRVHIFQDFTQSPKAVLFATDIAARGLDFPAVDWVLQVVLEWSCAHSVANCCQLQPSRVRSAYAAAHGSRDGRVAIARRSIVRRMWIHTSTVWAARHDTTLAGTRCCSFFHRRCRWPPSWLSAKCRFSRSSRTRRNLMTSPRYFRCVQLNRVSPASLSVRAVQRTAFSRVRPHMREPHCAASHSSSVGCVCRAGNGRLALCNSSLGKLLLA